MRLSTTIHETFNNNIIIRLSTPIHETFNNIYMSTGPDMLNARILRALEDKLAGPSHTYLIIQSKQELFLEINKGVSTEFSTDAFLRLEISKRDCNSQKRKQAGTWKLQTH